MSSHDHPEDFGGLHPDLAETMSRRDLLRVTTRLGLGLGAFPLLGCGSDDMTDPFACD